MWVGLLFGIICLAVMATDASDSMHSDVEQQRLQIELYRERTVQCLVMGQYSKSGPYVLEAMIHYVYVEMLFHADSSKDLWYLLALEVNLAKRMGYHRDPSHFSGISPLEAEMRRRVWVTVLLGDLLISSQMGMPRMIADWQCDTAEPKNLQDTDIDLDSPGSADLPPARPETEHTAVLGVIARRRMLVALGAVSDLTAATETCSYAEVMRVDGVLHEALAGVPPPLRMRALASSITDPPQLIMSRLFLGHMFHKGQIMLHRRFLGGQEGGDETAYSRGACLDAALGTLRIQHALDEETRPGGLLHAMRWRVSSIMNHQFLTATMILCVLLQRGQTLRREEEVKTVLRETRGVWLRGSAGSVEARKGAEVIGMVLARSGADLGAEGRPSLGMFGQRGGGLSVEHDTFATNLDSSDVADNYRAGAVFQETAGQLERECITTGSGVLNFCLRLYNIFRADNSSQVVGL